MNNNSKKTPKQLTGGLCLAVFLIVIDQLTKLAASSGLKSHSDFILIPGVLQLHYLENQSAAFSLDPVTLFQRIFQLSYFNEHPNAFLQCKMIFFVILTLVVILLLVVLYAKIPQTRRFMPMNLILLFFIAGAIGNLIDRVFNQYVVDFIYFSLINFPVFNVADIYVTCAAICFILFGLFYYKDEDYETIFPSRKKKSPDAAK